MAGEIFISYRRADEPRARLLYNKLKDEGVEAWYDAQVGAGEDWRKATAHALDRSKIFVLLFSKAAAESDDIAKELAAATFSKKLVVPVRIENIQPTGSFLYELASRNWIDAYQDTDAKLGELAKNLATLVKKGKAVPTQLPSGREAPVAKPPSRIGLMAAGGALVLAVVVGAGAYLMKPGPEMAKAAPVAAAKRIAFFGFDGATGDARLTQLAAGITEEVFQGLDAERLETFARNDTIGTLEADRLGKAAKMGAAYALSGDVRVDGERTTATIRLVDVPSRTVLWEEPVAAKTAGAHYPYLQTRTASMAAATMRCVVDLRGSMKTDSMEAARLIPRACRDSLMGVQPNVSLWRSLVAAAGDAPLIEATFASAMQAYKMRIPEDTQTTLQKDSEALAEKLSRNAPNSPEAALARFEAARWRRDSLASQETILLEGLRTSPDDSALNYWYSYFLASAGRTVDAIPYAQSAVANNPLRAGFYMQLGRIQSNAGMAPLATESYRKGYVMGPSGNNWFGWMAGAMFDNAGNPQMVLKLAPEDINPAIVQCWGAAITPAASRDKAVRLKGLSDMMTCGQTAFLDVAPGLLAVVAVAFGADTLQSTTPVGAIRYGTGNAQSMFLPSAKAMRANPNFVRFAKDLSMLDYWKTGKFPDFCLTEDAPVCRAIGAPPPAPNSIFPRTLPN